MSAYGDIKYPHFRETLSDTARLPSISHDVALALVKEFANNTELDLTNMELTEDGVIEKEDARIDHEFTFKGNDNHEDTIGDARKIYEFKVHGNHIARVSTQIKLPEAWEREWRKQTLYDNFHMFSFFSIIILIIVLGIRYLLQLIKNNEPNWKLALYFAGLFYIINIIDFMNSATRLFYYKTQQVLHL